MGAGGKKLLLPTWMPTIEWVGIEGTNSKFHIFLFRNNGRFCVCEDGMWDCGREGGICRGG